MIQISGITKQMAFETKAQLILSHVAVKYDANPGAEGFPVQKPTKAKKSEK